MSSRISLKRDPKKKAARQAKRADRKDTRQAKRTARKETRQEKREVRKDARQEKRQIRKENRKKVVKKVVNKAKDTVDRIGDSLKKNTVKIWPTPNAYNCKFPEQEYAELKKKKDVALCFSGGGTRSATCSLGQMRALNKLGYDKKARYIGCISGGSWFAIPYTYLPRSINDRKFLGPYLPPERCKIDNLYDMSKTNNIFAYSLAHSEFITPQNLKMLAKNSLWPPSTRNSKDDETWGMMLGNALLKNINLYNPKKQTFATWKSRQRDEIIKRNKHLEKNDFTCVEKDRPFLLTNGTIINWNIFAKMKSIAKVEWPFYPIEFTPVYTGINARYEGTETAGLINFGGGYVENIGFDTTAPISKLTGNEVKVRTRKNYNRLSIQDMMATSGAAPAYHALLASFIADIASFLKVPKILTGTVKALTGVFPEYNYWKIAKDKKVWSHRLPFGDGGFCDNYGIMPALKRGTRTLVVFINTETPFMTKEPFEKASFASTAEIAKKQLVIDGLLPTLFGVNNLESSQGVPYKWALGKNQIFSKADFLKTINKLWKAKISDGPVYAKCKYRLKSNSYHGIKGGHDVTVIWFYNNQVKDWEHALPLSARDRINYDDDFKSFPHYETFLATKDTKDADFKDSKSLIKRIDPVDMKPDQVSLLSNLSAWCVLEAHRKGVFKDVF